MPFRRLEGAIERVLRERDTLRTDLAGANARVAEVEDLLRRFTEDDAEPARMQRRLRRLEEEHGDMRARLVQARETVERLLARIRYLEEQR